MGSQKHSTSKESLRIHLDYPVSDSAAVGTPSHNAPISANFRALFLKSLFCASPAMSTLAAISHSAAKDWKFFFASKVKECIAANFVYLQSIV